MGLGTQRTAQSLSPGTLQSLILQGRGPCWPRDQAEAPMGDRLCLGPALGSLQCPPAFPLNSLLNPTLQCQTRSKPFPNPQIPTGALSPWAEYTAQGCGSTDWLPGW